MRYFSCPKGKEDKLQEALTSGEYFGQEKIDGASYIFSKDKDGNIGLFSRAISKKTDYYSEKSDNVPHIIEQLNKLPNGTMVIGEIAYPGGSSKDATTIMGCLPKKAVERNKTRPIHYYIFDVIYFNNKSVHEWRAEDRIEFLRKEFYSLDLDSETIHFLPPIYTDLDKRLKNILKYGGEGMVLKRKDAPYNLEGKRPSWHTIKIKQLDTVDVVIIDIQYPTKQYNGKNADSYQYRDENGNPINRLYALNMANGFVIGAIDADGQLQKIGTVSSGLTDEIRLNAANNPDKYINTVVEVAMMSKDCEAKSLRHPRLINIRDDKHFTECTIQEIFS